MFFTYFGKGCRSKRVCILITTLERVAFCPDTVKRGINFKMSKHTV